MIFEIIVCQVVQFKKNRRLLFKKEIVTYDGIFDMKISLKRGMTMPINYDSVGNHNYAVIIPKPMNSN